ncbi:amidohydrolase family protein [Metaclostridioides mangenotii]|uniref:5-methylthioadenosine/S-adenosylhomocysteine deaminase n=1 Tax=Metaclostridioides mangenotii TaxID=1540 RepID=A0ABS4E8F0_9FIRM|nr:amidohydrolase [Clostridioides mangenotii]MBP1854196.1 5-methylthioadenosine/S-adenosylhomocysteine deaminase [Clostridioides mangenotii]
MIDILIKNAIIVTVNKNREVLFDGAIAIKDDRILDIGNSKDLELKYTEVKKVVGGNGKVIFPGFINTHNHLFQVLLKGLGDDMALDGWLNSMMFPSAKFLTEQDTYDAAMHGCVEGLKSGITTMVDYMHTHNRAGLTDGIIKAYQDLGIRGVIGRGCIDLGIHKELIEDVVTVEKDLRRLFDKYHNSYNGRIKLCVAPSSMWAISEEMGRMLWKIVKEYDSYFTVHLSETDFARNKTKEIHGEIDIKLLEKWDILGPEVVAVHCVCVDNEDIEILKKYNIKVSHNVASNMYLASGVAPVPEMLKAEINVSLGLDGAASNNSQDMVELMKLTALQHKVDKCDPLAISAEKVLEMATIEGARTLRMEDEIGSLEIGKKADLVVFNSMLSPKSIPLHNPVSTLVYSSTMDNIETVIVDGNMIMEDGDIKTIESEEKVYKNTQKAAEELCKRADISNRMEGHTWNSLF